MITERKYILGIDPGHSGALALIDTATKPCRFVTVIDMPLIAKSNERNEIDQNTLTDFIKAHGPDIKFCVIEDVSAMTYTDNEGKLRGQGAAASFAFGKSVGVVLGILSHEMIPIHKVKPSVWKILLNLSKNKNDSIALAKKIFPEAALFLTRKKDDGRAEALLLAHFGRERLMPK